MAEDPTAPPRGAELAEAVAAVVDAYVRHPQYVRAGTTLAAALEALIRAAGREVPQ